MEVLSFDGFALDHDLPLQQQLYAECVAHISAGLWPPGTRLPASRQIAEQLGVSRNTVTAALAQLQAEGFVVSRRGSGVYVHDDLPQRLEAADALPWVNPSQLPRLSDYGEQLARDPAPRLNNGLPFTLGIPDLDAFPLTAWTQILRRQQQRKHLLGFDDFQGYRPLREALAHYLGISRQVYCEPDQILITQGAQQGISLCARVLLNPGEEVLVEDPGYVGARRAFASQQARLTGIPVDERGLLVERLPQQTPARLMYTTPTHHYPLGGIMSASERLRLLDWAAATDTWLIEDDYDSEFHFHGKPIAALQGMAEETPVLYLGSFSKTLFPSLRLGYLVLPRPLVKTFVAAKAQLDGESPLVMQATAAEFLEGGHFVRHLRRMRTRYQGKWEHLRQLLQRHLAGLAEPLAESAGMHLVLRIDGVDDRALAGELLSRGFGCSPLSAYYLGEGHSGLALGFANSNESQREAVVALLAELLPGLLRP